MSPIWSQATKMNVEVPNFHLRKDHSDVSTGSHFPDFSEQPQDIPIPGKVRLTVNVPECETGRHY
jgi:hypothetical protein